MTCKKSLVVIWKITRHFPNTLSSDGKYSLLNRDNLTQQIQMQVSRKKKLFSEFFSSFLKSSLNFEHLKKKRWLSYLKYFRNSGPSKSWLHQCLKSLVSRDPSKSNMVNAPKHYWNLHGRTFTIFIDHCEANWLAKSLSEWYAKYQDSFLTHWVPMASILFLIETI